MSDSQRWQCVAAVASSMRGKKRLRDTEEAAEEGRLTDTEPEDEADQDPMVTNQLVLAASSLEYGALVFAAVREKGSELSILPVLVEMVIGRKDQAHPWHDSLVSLPARPASILWWEPTDQEGLKGTGAERLMEQVRASAMFMHHELKGLNLPTIAEEAGSVESLLWADVNIRSRRFTLPGTGVPAVPKDGMVTDVCSLLLWHGKISNSELLLREGVALQDNPYDSVEIHLQQPHTGDQTLLEYKESLLNSAEDIPQWQHDKVEICACRCPAEGAMGFSNRERSRLALSLSSTQQLCLRRGVPLALLHALSCIQVTSLDEEPEVSGVTLETAKELIQAVQEQLGKPPAPDADSVLDVYKHAQHSILEEAIEALEAAGEEEAGLSIEHMQVHEIDSIFSEKECKRAIANAEEYAAAHGWSKQRHIAHPTTDLAVDSVRALAWMTEAVQSRILDKVAQLFNIEPVEISELFLAKYDVAGIGQPSLGEHVDGSPWSFVVALNNDFHGGGTQFVDLEGEPNFIPHVGGAILFSGKNRHKGCAITKGVRYILAGFLNYKTNGA